MQRLRKELKAWDRFPVRRPGGWKFWRDGSGRNFRRDGSARDGRAGIRGRHVFLDQFPQPLRLMGGITGEKDPVSFCREAGKLVDKPRDAPVEGGLRRRSEIDCGSGVRNRADLGEMRVNDRRELAGEAKEFIVGDKTGRSFLLQFRPFSFDHRRFIEKNDGLLGEIVEERCVRGESALRISFVGISCVGTSSVEGRYE